MSVASEDEHMSAVARLAPIVLLVGTLHLDLTPQARGEIVEEIVAWVDGDIITKSDLERQESDLIEAARQRYSGDELRRRLEAVRETTLLDIIDHKILHHRGQQLWGSKEIEESYYRSFRQQQGLSDDEEFEQLLAQEGLTVERLKHLLSEKFVPDQVREHEVAVLIPGISDLEARDYYDRHPDQFMAPAEMTIREIVLLAESEADKANRRKEAERVRGRAVAEDFAAVAREVSDAETRLDGGLLGPLHEGDLGEPLESYALGMDAGQVSAVIVAPDGFHIIKLESRSEERLIPFDESIDRARTTLQNERYMEQLEAFVEMARGEAEWWVKAEYRDYLPEGVKPTREEIP
jgi:parvulin-like peptidyl-prolyl isomerase